MKRSLFVLVCASVSCGLPPKESAIADTKQYIEKNLGELATASKALCDAAPAAKATGWSAADDAAAIGKMKGSWKQARVSYERVEGAIAQLFQELDVSTDERYDGFLESTEDSNLFDDVGVIGNHAIERILWSDSIPAEVVEFEKTLGPKYQAARFPQNEAESRDFKEKLCARFAGDTAKMRDEFKPFALDSASAFRGVIGSINEQLEKTTLAATGAEESRYAQFTLSDMRANLEGGIATFNAFKPWLVEQKGDAVVKEIEAGFAKLKAAYTEVTGDAIPRPPATWSEEMPTDADRQTAFGKLFTIVEREASDKIDGALVFEMNEAAELLKIPQLPSN
jgi:iron uptake system component EfeO